MGHYYAFDHRHVCCNAFCILHDFSVKKLKNLKAHLQKNELSAVAHGNRDQRSHRGYLFEVIKDVVAFIKKRRKLKQQKSFKSICTFLRNIIHSILVQSKVPQGPQILPTGRVLP